MTTQNLPQANEIRKFSFKRLTIFVLLGILICLAVTSIYMPRMIVWYFEPPAALGVSCGTSIDWAIHKLQFTQMISIGVGAVLGFAGAFLIKRK